MQMLSTEPSRFPYTLGVFNQREFRYVLLSMGATKAQILGVLKLLKKNIKQY
jgi:hypothetical protein